MQNNKRIFQFILVLILAQAACAIPREPAPTPDLPVTFTLVAGSLTAQALLPPTPTITHTPTATLIPTATSICDAAQFVQDISLPDNTILKPGEQATKTWRLKNTGSCAWTTSYAIVFATGDPLGAASVIALPGNVAPGEVVDLSVPVTAPSINGTYKSNWLLRNPSGHTFGMNGAPDQPFWLSIQVTDAVYDFVSEACAAEWIGNGHLDCPGKETDARGFVIPFAKKTPRLEDGAEYNAAALLTRPATGIGGVISGRYPGLKIERGYRFLAQIGCRFEETDPNCGARFQINYLTADGQLRNLFEKDQFHDGALETINIDLSALAGQTVQFVLTVIANGDATDDSAVWIAPRLTR